MCRERGGREGEVKVKRFIGILRYTLVALNCTNHSLSLQKEHSLALRRLCTI